MDRRNFVKLLSAMGMSSLPLSSSLADETKGQEELYGILIDLTRCVGCQNCSVVCAEANGLPEPDLDIMFESKISTSPSCYTVINSYEIDGEEYYVKQQCMHCNQPACAAACPTQALEKTEKGPVIWDGDKCMGCRFCMVSCPFDIPKFEYDSANPRITKCIMCWERLNKGEQPVCVENCPEEAILFGKRREILDEANSRIYSDPSTYVHHIYGEHEVGGTSIIYISPVPFEQLGFRTDLGPKPYPEYTKTFLYSVPVVLTLWPVFLLALRNSHEEEREEGHNGR
jgi:Fe-S-cluster-containing dehydrogenase component